LLDRRRPAKNSARRIIDSLRKMNLVDNKTLEEARQEAFRRAQSGQTEANLWPSTKAHLLALCLGQQNGMADQDAVKLLENANDPFPRFLLAGFLENQGETRRALEVLTVEPEGELSAWFRLERARLLLETGEIGDLGGLCVPIMQSSEVPPSEIAGLAVLIAQKGGDELGWLAQGLLSAVIPRSQDELSVKLSACKVELALD